MKHYSIGIDPDLHVLPVALVSKVDDLSPNLEGIWTVKAKGNVKEEAVAAILSALMSEEPGGIPKLLTLQCSGRGTVRPQVTIESQNVSYTGRTNAANPQDLISLAQVAGGCLGMFGYGRLVQPRRWKKTMPKKICQAGAYSKLGLTYTVMGGSVQKRQYCVPDNYEQYDATGNLNKGDFKDAGDSIALALWGLEN